MNFIFFFFLSLILNFFLFKYFIQLAKKFKIIDITNNFNNSATVTSGGLIIYLNLIIGNILFYWLDNSYIPKIPHNAIVAFGAFSILFIISFIDDVKPIDPKIKLAFQIVIIYFSLTSLKISEFGLPLKISIFFGVIMWVYITNIINFIDGVDGFANTQIIFVFLSILFINYNLNIEVFSKYLSLVLLPCLLIFSYFNKPHAKLYLGDTGSISLGFLIGYAVIELFILKHYTIALSLIIYPLLDCTITLIKRIYEGHPPWVKRQDYFFSKLQVINVNNKFYISKINLIFCILNLFFIFFQILFSNYFIICNIFLAIITMAIYNKKEKLF
jgi:UDP-N-acetylmuramyl pentapeptide phosphotransferase/UDP-N-acetylglucosamine-1-phosphate transferase